MQFTISKTISYQCWINSWGAPYCHMDPWISAVISMLPFLPRPGPSVPAVARPGAQLPQLRKPTPPTPPLLVSIWCSSVACIWDESTAHWHDCFPPLSLLALFHKPYWTCCFALSVSRHLWGQSGSDSWLTSTGILSSEFMWPPVHHWCHNNFTMLSADLVVTYPSCVYLFNSPLKWLMQAAWLGANFLTAPPSEGSAGGCIPRVFSGIYLYTLHLNLFSLCQNLLCFLSCLQPPDRIFYNFPPYLT